MDWILSGSTILGNFLIGRKNKLGWIVFTLAGFLWLYYALIYLHPAQYGLLPATLVNLVIGVTSYIKWFREDKVNGKINSNCYRWRCL